MLFGGTSFAKDSEQYTKHNVSTIRGISENKQSNTIRKHIRSNKQKRDKPLKSEKCKKLLSFVK